MTQNKGTLIGSTIHPFSPEDNYPVADTIELKGGHMQVDTIAQRDAIPMERRKELMLVSVAADDQTYQLKKNAVDNNLLTLWESQSQGLKGDPGVKGDTGAQGAQGLKGDTGAQGAQGVKGDTGAQGVKGDTGAQGVQGLKGDTGAQGAQGVKGDTGAQGTQGLKGDTGESISEDVVFNILDSVLPPGMVDSSGSKREHFLDILCAGSVDTKTGGRLNYWGERRVDGYPFKAELCNTSTIRITHNCDGFNYGILAMMQHYRFNGPPLNPLLDGGEAPRNVCVSSTTDLDICLFSEDFGVRGGWCDFIIYKLR